MLYRILIVTVLALVATNTVGCAGVGKALFPEAYMTPEEKAELQAKRDALAARNTQDLTTPGEPHEEARDGSIVGSYRYDKKIAGKFNVMFKKTKKQGHHRLAAEMTLFENGSFAHRQIADCYEGDGWSYGNMEPGDVRRGQWKTADGKIFVRYMTFGGYAGWGELGHYEKKGRNLLVVNKAQLEAAVRRVPENDLEAALAAVAENTHAWNRR